MVHFVNRETVKVDANPIRTVWFLINKETVPMPLGAEAGLVAYNPLGSPDERPTPHKDPDSEFFYVMSGEGVLFHDGEETSVKAGDAFVVPAGVSHALWSSGDEPMNAFYVEMVPR